MKRKALILRLSSLGDIAHASSVFAPLLAASCEIFFVVKPGFRGLLESCAPGVKIYVYDPSGGEREAREKFFKWVEINNFNLILDLHDSLRTKLWRRRLRRFAPVHVARKPRLRELGIYFFRQKWLGLGRGGRARRMREAASRAVLELWGVEFTVDQAPLTQLSVPATDIKSIYPVLRAEYVVLVPGSAWLGKRWPEQKFTNFAKLVARQFPVVVLGGEGEDYCERIAAAARGAAPESVSLHGRTGIGECAQVLAAAKFIVGNDTGLVHLAEAIGKDVVAIEGPTHPALGYSVYRENSRILSAGLVCSPCSKNGHPCWRGGGRACLERIDENMALAALSFPGSGDGT